MFTHWAPQGYSRGRWLRRSGACTYRSAVSHQRRWRHASLDPLRQVQGLGRASRFRLVARTFGEPPSDEDLDSDRDWKAAANYDAPATSALSPRLPFMNWENAALCRAEEAWLAEELRIWLDREWEPLAVHREIGEKASKATLAARQQLERRGRRSELGPVLLSVADELERGSTYRVSRESWREAYVNAFDVANKVSDLYMVRFFIDTEVTEQVETNADDPDAVWTSLPLSDTCRCTGLSYEDMVGVQRRAQELGLAIGRTAQDDRLVAARVAQMDTQTNTPTLDDNALYDREYSAEQVESLIESFDDALYRERVVFEALRTKRMVQERGLYGDFALGTNEEYLKAEFPSDKVWGWDPDTNESGPLQPDSKVPRAELVESTPFDGIKGSIRDVHPFDRHVFFMSTLHGDVPNDITNRVVLQSARLANHSQLLDPAFDIEVLLNSDDGIDNDKNPIVVLLNELAVEVAFDALRKPASDKSSDVSTTLVEENTQADDDSDADALLREQIRRDLDLIIETLYGEVATQMALHQRDRGFIVRSAVVRYLASFTW
ncbi:hypothetical protein CCYA_CCYA05G1635 [Cyanidiococcus yangmingshanensis]|nr:hypothetical protein CCYA_CCYA05G1635 [Cyanidiococcus yangmingshanensis]